MKRNGADTLMSLREIGFRYPSDAPTSFVLHRLSLELLDGEVIRLEGRNGTGKSTLLQIIADILRPVEGTIVRHIDTARIIYLNQNPSEFLGESLTVQEQLSVAAADRHAAMLTTGTLAFDLLATFGIGLEVRRSAFTGELSGGQKQILALVCVLIAKPRLLILDEFTAYMDDSSVSTACKLVSKFTQSSSCGLVYVDQSKSLPLTHSRVISLALCAGETSSIPL